jgi:hypothetical protein
MVLLCTRKYISSNIFLRCQTWLVGLKRELEKEDDMAAKLNEQFEYSGL